MSGSSYSDFEGFWKLVLTSTLLKGNTTLSTMTVTSALMKIFLTALIMTRTMFHVQFKGNHEKTFRKNTVISVLFTLDMKFFLHFTTY